MCTTESNGRGFFFFSFWLSIYTHSTSIDTSTPELAQTIKRYFSLLLLLLHQIVGNSFRRFIIILSSRAAGKCVCVCVEAGSLIYILWKPNQNNKKWETCKIYEIAMSVFFFLF